MLILRLHQHPAIAGGEEVEPQSSKPRRGKALSRAF